MATLLRDPLRGGCDLLSGRQKGAAIEAGPAVILHIGEFEAFGVELAVGRHMRRNSTKLTDQRGWR